MSTPPRQKVVILGAGFGGLELATRLAEEVPELVDVTLIDQRDSFVFGFSKLEVLFGRQSAEEVRLYYRDIAAPGVEFRQETIQSIDPALRRVVTDAGEYEADILVVALGADLDVAATPGLAEGGHEFYSNEGADRTREVLAAFAGGDIGGDVVVAVLGNFYKCPPAPYETAFLLHDFLVERGIRDRCTIKLLTPLPSAIPVSAETSAAIAGALAERGVELWTASLVTGLDPSTGVATLKDGRTVHADVFLGIPVHKAPDVVTASALAVDGWIPVDVATMATPFPGVYAVGDVTSAPVPRAGVIAEGEAATLADHLVSVLRDGDATPSFQGEVKCYIEWGEGQVAKVDVNFLSGPKPVAVFNSPSAGIHVEKEEFARVRRARWFGA